MLQINYRIKILELFKIIYKFSFSFINCNNTIGNNEIYNLFINIVFNLYMNELIINPKFNSIIEKYNYILKK